MPRRVLIIANPTAAAGRATRTLRELLSHSAARGLAPAIATTAGPGDATRLARAAADEGQHDCIVAAGGDGTVREVADGILSSRRPGTAFALLPLGTGNDFAHLAGVGSPDRALAALAEGSPSPRDVIGVQLQTAGQAQSTHALSFAAVGLAADVVRLTTPAVKRWFGPRLCYSVGFLRALRRYEPFAAEVLADGRSFRESFLHVCAGNTSHAGGRMMHLSPGARADDGRLNLSLVRATRRIEVLRQFMALLRGTHIRHPRVDYFETHDVTVSTPRPADVQLDGDCVGTTPARFVVKPNALQVITGSGR
jgi:YegS/Rv2252/BmrU family lipid kinase